MKKLVQILLFLTITCVSSQDTNNNWLLFSQENIITIDINSTVSFEINNLKFNIIWDKKLSFSKNIGYYGGIRSLTIYKNNKLLQTIKNIEDGIALGTILINFYDYNLDGFLDFTIPIECGKSCWYKYFIFNPLENKYENPKGWDYLRIQKINKLKKQISSEPNGNAFDDNSELYQIRGLELNKLR